MPSKVTLLALTLIFNFVTALGPKGSVLGWLKSNTVLQDSRAVVSAPETSVTFPAALKLEDHDHLVQKFRDVSMYMKSLESKPSCYQIATKGLEDCEFLRPGFSSSQIEVEQLTSRYAVKIALCELREAEGSIRIPSECEILESPAPVSNSIVKFCIKGLGKAPQSWTSFIVNRVNLVPACEATRDYFRMNNSIEVIHNMVSNLADLDEAVVERIKSLQVQSEQYAEFMALVRERSDELVLNMESSHSKIMTTADEVEKKLRDTVVVQHKLTQQIVQDNALIAKEQESGLQRVGAATVNVSIEIAFLRDQLRDQMISQFEDYRRLHDETYSARNRQLEITHEKVVAMMQEHTRQAQESFEKIATNVQLLEGFFGGWIVEPITGLISIVAWISSSLLNYVLWPLVVILTMALTFFGRWSAIRSLVIIAFLCFVGKAIYDLLWEFKYIGANTESKEASPLTGFKILIGVLILWFVSRSSFTHLGSSSQSMEELGKRFLVSDRPQEPIATYRFDRHGSLSLLVQNGPPVPVFPRIPTSLSRPDQPYSNTHTYPSIAPEPGFRGHLYGPAPGYSSAG